MADEEFVTSISSLLAALAEEQKGILGTAAESESTTFSESLGKSVSSGTYCTRDSQSLGKAADVSRPVALTIPTQSNQTSTSTPANSRKFGGNENQK